MAAGDLDGNGDDELIVAQMWPEGDTERSSVAIHDYHPAWRATGDITTPDYVDTLYVGDECDGGGYSPAIAAGDLDGNGADELLIAMTACAETVNYICFVDAVVFDVLAPDGDTWLLGDNSIDLYPAIPVYQHDGTFHVTAMTMADFDGDLADDVLIACSMGVENTFQVIDRMSYSTDLWYGYLRDGWLGCTDQNPDCVDIVPNGERVYNGSANELYVTAMARGEIDHEWRDEVFIAMSSNDGTDNRILFTDDPHLGSLGHEIALSPQMASRRTTTMAMGDFFESLPSSSPPPKKPKEELPPPSGRPAVDGIPTVFYLERPMPNPFAGTTNVEFGLPQDAHVRITIYDLRGRVVRRLVNRSLPAGVHLARWDGADATGADVASGVYFCRMESDDFASDSKMLFLK